ncbi:MAG: M15 family metallopeptidase [Ferruginibacter sp.]
MTAQEILTQRYGKPTASNFESKWMVVWKIREEFAWFPKAKIYIHKDFMAKLRVAFTALQQNNLHKEIKTCEGAFNIRLVRGSSSVYSIHSWGCAIDMNAADNPLASTGKWSTRFIQTMETCGIFCGQNWIGRKDPMHFALVNG